MESFAPNFWLRVRRREKLVKKQALLPVAGQAPTRNVVMNQKNKQKAFQNKYPERLLPKTNKGYTQTLRLLNFYDIDHTAGTFDQQVQAFTLFELIPSGLKLGGSFNRLAINFHNQVAAL